MAKIRVTIIENEKDIKKSSITSIEEQVNGKWVSLGLLSQIGLMARAKKLVKALMGS